MAAAPVLPNSTLTSDWSRKAVGLVGYLHVVVSKRQHVRHACVWALDRLQIHWAPLVNRYRTSKHRLITSRTQKMGIWE